MADVATLSFEDKLGEVITRTIPKVSPELGAQLQALLDPVALGIMAGVLVAWIVGHVFGYGEVIDVVVTVGGFIAIGWSVFTGIDELYEFGKTTYDAKTDADLETAANHLAKAIAILGIQVVLSILFKGRPKGGRVRQPTGPKGPGLRYKPSIVRDPALPAGTGETTFFGDITVSTAGTANEQALALLHEKVHSFFAPKFYLLRQFRVENRVGSYVKSSLFRYIDEALSETIAQVGVNGFRHVFVGIRFPVSNGYVFITKAGSSFDPLLKGAGLMREGCGLIAAGLVSGFAYEIWFKPDPNPKR